VPDGRSVGLSEVVLVSVCQFAAGVKLVISSIVYFGSYFFGHC